MNESFNQSESYGCLDCFDFVKQIARTIICFQFYDVQGYQFFQSFQYIINGDSKMTR